MYSPIEHDKNYDTPLSMIKTMTQGLTRYTEWISGSHVV